METLLLWLWNYFYSVLYTFLKSYIKYSLLHYTRVFPNAYIISYIIIISQLLLLNLKLIPAFQFHFKYLFRDSIGCFVLLNEQLCT